MVESGQEIFEKKLVVDNTKTPESGNDGKTTITLDAGKRGADVRFNLDYGYNDDGVLSVTYTNPGSRFGRGMIQFTPGSEPTVTPWDSQFSLGREHVQKIIEKVKESMAS